MRLIKVTKNAWKKVAEIYNAIPNTRNMCMTDFLQELVNKGVAVTAVPVHSGWIEIDSMRDSESYKNLFLFPSFKQLFF